MDILNSKEFADSFYTEQEEAHKNPASRRGFYFPSAWYMKMTGGLRKGWLSYFMGKAKAGKTSAMITSALTSGLQKNSFVYFALEEGVISLAGRIFAAQAQISRVKFRDINMEQADWPKLASARAVIEQFNGTWVYGAFDLNEMCKVINQVDPDIIYIDYLQLMNPTHVMKVDSRTMEVSENSRSLKRIANGDYPGLKVKRPRAVCAAAQLNDKGEALWSRDIDRDCDNRIDIELIDDGLGGFAPDRRKMVLSLNRHGDTGANEMKFVGEFSMLVEMAQKASTSPLKKKPILSTP